MYVDSFTASTPRCVPQAAEQSRTQHSRAQHSREIKRTLQHEAVAHARARAPLHGPSSQPLRALASRPPLRSSSRARIEWNPLSTLATASPVRQLVRHGRPGDIARSVERSDDTRVAGVGGRVRRPERLVHGVGRCAKGRCENDAGHEELDHGDRSRRERPQARYCWARRFSGDGEV